ncbi:GNAT family N-acetyltransferase [Paenibacillus validus]|uniref:GNAT family N-acetyltransferase n=1 Tax=Paenibacillus TaxID=44249 RepID=UPI0006CFD829|nr:GNAT family N-acetyltransferase [Paenibacillus validus]MED4600812.1 GNAT family N-acetyltransferase [Paenibacillus validus]MED4608076.1 GNAT family N-acetyltransferase [Paenibacillus validus]
MHIAALQRQDHKSVMHLYKAVTSHLRENGIYQWDRFYPNRFVIHNDLKNGCLFGVKQDGAVIAAVVVDEKQSSKYLQVNWQDRQGKAACIHRLAVHPDYQGMGLGKKLLQFAEQYTLTQGCSSIRLDVYSANETALAMYTRAGYMHTGAVQFPFRSTPYYCFEKIL